MNLSLSFGYIFKNNPGTCESFGKPFISFKSISQNFQELFGANEQFKEV